jgi:hypothetical protein
MGNNNYVTKIKWAYGKIMERVIIIIVSSSWINN